MSRGYLLLFCSFLITVEAIAADKSEVAVNICASAAVADSPEKTLFTSQPEEVLLSIVGEGFKPIASDENKELARLLMREIIHLKGLMDYLAKQVEKGEEIPYTESGIIPNYEGNFATFIFQNVISMYSTVLMMHNQVNSDDTRYIVDIYQQRMRFLLSDKDKRVDVNHQVGGANFLMIAAASGYDDIVELLIQREADLSHRATSGRLQGQTVLQITRRILDRHKSDLFHHQNAINVLSLNHPDIENRDPEYVRKLEKIERYNRIIELLEAASATT